LTAVESVILVIDCVKGVEEQTEKLMNVCRMRNTPVIIFINKLDREGKNPFELLDEIEEKLDIKVKPLSWPVGIGSGFKGVYNIYENTFNFFKSNKQKVEKDVEVFNDINDERLSVVLGDSTEKLKKDLDLVNGVYGDFDVNEYLSGVVAPVYFGSALNNFGVKELLDSFISIAPNPRGRETTAGIINSDDENFSGFVFKIHANLNPKHRDRIAFLRVCSGKFERNKFYHHVRLDRDIKFPNPAVFMASDKKLIEEAYPGEVIGLYDSGIFKIGDTLTEGEKFMFKGIPTFSPEIFKELRLNDPFKAKQMDKGIIHLTDEGLAQVFIQYNGNRKIVGTVGELQFDVIQYRLQNEYGVDCKFSPVNYHKACWILYDKEEEIQELLTYRSHNLFTDKHKNLVFMSESPYQIEKAIMNNPKAKFLFNIEHNIDTIEEK